MGQKLICEKCQSGTLRWVDYKEDVDIDLSSNLKCTNCGFIYKGMQDFIDRTKGKNNANHT